MSRSDCELNDYQQAWAYLDSLQFFKIKLGLESMERFLGRVGNPQRALNFIHVAGTNGKGSTAAALLAILSRAGYRVGLYTSPHLSSVRERFRINDRYISEADFTRHAATIHGVLAGEQITYFEFTTALALLWFAEQKVDLAILEVGMGGRLDATNVITPLVGVITNVSMDHQAYLGNTLAEVAWEKAGIIKPGVPLVSGVAADESQEVVEKRCRELGAPFYLLGRDFAAVVSARSSHLPQAAEPGNRLPQDAAGDQPRSQGGWDYRGMGRNYRELPTVLVGRHQLANLSLVLATLELLDSRFHVGEEAVRAGLAAVRWPGRLELLEVKDRPAAASASLPVYPAQSGDCGPLAAPAAGAGGGCSAAGEAGAQGARPRRFLLDGAHNPAGVESLVAALQNNFAYERLIVVWAGMADKDLVATLGLIAPLGDLFIFTRPESERSATPEVLRELLPPPARAAALGAANVGQALQLAWEHSRPTDLILVAGSLYLVGAARKILAGELVN